MDTLRPSEKCVSDWAREYVELKRVIVPTVSSTSAERRVVDTKLRAAVGGVDRACAALSGLRAWRRNILRWVGRDAGVVAVAMARSTRRKSGSSRAMCGPCAGSDLRRIRSGSLTTLSSRVFRLSSSPLLTHLGAFYCRRPGFASVLPSSATCPRALTPSLAGACRGHASLIRDFLTNDGTSLSPTRRFIKQSMYNARSISQPMRPRQGICLNEADKRKLQMFALGIFVILRRVHASLLNITRSIALQ